MGNANAAMRVADGDDGDGGALPLPPPPPSPLPELETAEISSASLDPAEASDTCARVSSSVGHPSRPLSVQVPNLGIVAAGHGAISAEKNTSPLYCNSSSISNNANVVSRYQQISGHAIMAATSMPGAPGLGPGAVSAMNSTTVAAAPPPLPSPHHESSSNSTILPSVMNPTGAATDSPSILTEQHANSPLYPKSMVQSHMYASEKESQATEPENMIATLIEWKYGGTNVSVEGSWDDWSSRIPLQKSGKGFALIKILPEGVYHYRFIVDGELRHAPDLLLIFDTKGKAMNVLDVQDYVPESLDGLAEFETPSSPESSYDNYLPSAEDYSKDPPLLPSQLHLNSELESLHSASASISASPRPDHVILNHLFLETRKQARSPVLTLGFTHRFRSKYITVILHKPLRR